MGPFGTYKSFTLPHPPRIVFELFNLKSAQSKEQSLLIGENWVKQARHYAYPDKVRLVLDTKEDYLASYTATPTASGLTIKVGGDAAAIEEPASQPTGQIAVSGNEPALSKPNSKKQAGWVNRIDFAGEEAGKSTVIIGTTAPADYQLDKAKDTLLHLTLFNAKLPDYRERPLITTRFESAVDRIMPTSKPGHARDSLFTIELREAVPYFVEQKDNLLMVHFEASEVPPKAVEDRNLPAWQAALTNAPAATKQPAAPENSVDKFDD